MEALLYLIPAALLLGFVGLCGFLWALKSGQFDDLDGAAVRILIDDEGPELMDKEGPEPDPEPQPQDATTER